MGQKLILGVHGLSNKPPSALVESWWMQALLEGLQANRQLSLPLLPFRLVYWADVLYSAPTDVSTPYAPAPPGALKRYEDHWADVFLSTILDVGGDMLWTLKQLTGMTELAQEVLRRKLSDLYLYYTDVPIRDALRGRLMAAIAAYPDATIMLIAHSMGSIIAYDVLRLLGREGAGRRITHFITCGSPLGLPHVKYQILKEYPLMRTPSEVEQWTNLADRRDPVAVDVTLANDYAANDRGVRVSDHLVLNDMSGLHHAAYGYLRTPEMTDLVRAFL
jgi:hypothetical protein